MIEIKPAYSEKEAIQELFQDYTNMLVQHDPSFQAYLDLQHYEDELLHLEETYGLPNGRLYLIEVDGNAAGCIGCKKLDATSCELKRLYVKPQYRGQHLAQKLLDQIIADAKTIGYQMMYLDTLPFLTQALHLYETYGFVKTDAYNNSPMDNSIFMKLELKL